MSSFNRAISILAEPGFNSSLDGPDPICPGLLTKRAWAMARRSHSGVPHIHLRTNGSWRVKVPGDDRSFQAIEDAIDHLCALTGDSPALVLARHRARTGGAPE